MLPGSIWLTNLKIYELTFWYPIWSFSQKTLNWSQLPLNLYILLSVQIGFLHSFDLLFHQSRYHASIMEHMTMVILYLQLRVHKASYRCFWFRRKVSYIYSNQWPWSCCCISCKNCHLCTFCNRIGIFLFGNFTFFHWCF